MESLRRCVWNVCGRHSGRVLRPPAHTAFAPTPNHLHPPWRTGVLAHQLGERPRLRHVHRYAGDDRRGARRGRRGACAPAGATHATMAATPCRIHRHPRERDAAQGKPPNVRSDGVMNLDFAELLMDVVARRASDLHITAGAPPMVRIRGRLVGVEGYPRLSTTDTREIVYSILSNDQRQKLETEWQIDFAYSVPGHARFRVNAYFQRSAIGAAFRLIPADIVSIDDLGLPTAVHDFTKKPRGLVLVTGPTGSGKSTSLAAMIDAINETREEHIMTVEDPIEFLHGHKKCIINQREVGSDAQSFALALKAALRQDPDVILVGEMRDLDTISTALTAAETGHLVFATLHTQSAPQTIDRIIDVFPAHQQDQVRVQLSVALMGVMTQQLLPTSDGSGRVAACEILVADPGGAQPHPRGQDPPDPVRDADRLECRHADDGRGAGRAHPRRQDHPALRRAALLDARGAASSARLRWHGRGLIAWPPTSSRRWTSPARRPAARSKPTPSRSSPTS